MINKFTGKEMIQSFCPFNQSYKLFVVLKKNPVMQLDNSSLKIYHIHPPSGKTFQKGEAL
ncbi:MAG TPA: hypothetical protein DDY52_04610 [Candidatus Moranbacteria bacterium]|nr:hypothetical protein [Candidatus Moranbacteria bacterium]